MNNEERIANLLDPRHRAFFAFAHQDDELPYTGLLMRRKENAKFLWLTNGDGLGHISGIDPIEYGKMRIAENKKARSIIGIPEQDVKDFAISEIEIYDNFVEWETVPSRRGPIVDYFFGLARGMFEQIASAKPDIIFTLAFQGGHPEHDLVSAFAGFSARLLRTKLGKEIELVFLPEYEFTILVPLRFKPWYDGPVLEIHLTEQELQTKLAVIDAYESQQGLFEEFRSVIERIGRAAALFGKGFSWQEFLSKETFSPVGPNFDFFENPHKFEWENYMMDTHKGVKIRFEGMLKEILAEVWERMQKEL